MTQSEDWSNDAENSALITEINYIFKYFQIENGYFNLLYYFQMLLYIWLNKCSLGEDKKLISKTKITDPKLDQ